MTASNGWSPKPPGCLANVKAKKDCYIKIGTKRIPVTAKATYPDDPEYARRFQLVDKVNRGRYTQYQTMTSRPISVVVLSQR